MDIYRFALLGLSTGALYAICAQGIVLVYRASGVVNFAQGAFVMLGGYSYYELASVQGASTPVALVGVVAIATIVGVLTHLLIMRPLRNSSPLARAVATLGVLMLLQSIAILKYKHSLLSVESFLPKDTVTIAGASITQDRVILFAIGLVVTAILWAVYRFTAFGRITSAVAENEHAAASMGHSPDLIAGINWGIGAGLAGLTGALIAQITFLEPAQLSALVLPALAAALIGGFASYPLAFVAALTMGSAQSVLTLQVSTHGWWTGWPQALPFLVVIAYLVIRGQGIAVRSHVFDKLPAVGSGRIRVVPTAVLTLLAFVLTTFVLADTWVIAFTATLCFAIVCYSVLVVTGYAGQLSLAPYVLGGMGAFVAAKLMEKQDVPFGIAFIIGVVAAMLIGLLVGAPALRTRGVNLAVATLGISVALYALVLSNTKFINSQDGIRISAPSLFGIPFSPGEHPRRYAFVTIVALLLVILAVANLRRGTAGRRMLAVRSNERAALALGVSVYATKLYAFMLSAGIAAVGVSALAFMNDRVVFARFDIFTSIGVVTATVVGGVGMLAGPLIGSTLFDTSIVSRFISQWGAADDWMPLIGAIGVLLILVMGSDGVFEQNRVMGVALVEKIRTRRGVNAAVPDVEPATTERIAPERVAERTLILRELSVRFGGVVAVENMNLTVRPGTVHGLIGPNGAGKTTMIDAITGFVRSTGRIELDGEEIQGLGARKRAHRGLARSFQSGELFDDLDVRENLAVGGDDTSWKRFVTDLFWPGKVTLSPAALAAAQDFDLVKHFDEKPPTLPFGRRRLVAIGRAVAASPSILLLDEPASGLDDEEAKELAHLIRSLADDWGFGILLVEHNLEMVLGVCDEITVMAEGKELLAASPPSVVRTHPGVIKAYVGEEVDAGPAMAAVVLS